MQTKYIQKAYPKEGAVKMQSIARDWGQMNGSVRVRVHQRHFFLMRRPKLPKKPRKIRNISR